MVVEYRRGDRQFEASIEERRVAPVAVAMRECGIELGVREFPESGREVRGVLLLTSDEEESYRVEL